MSYLSTRSKSAIKTGLAMAIVYGIALRLGWMDPYWAGFAVMMISLPTEGQSLNKGANRMLGTFLGCAVALSILGLFPQERFWFMTLLSVYIALCTWMMTGKKHAYAWNVAGFVCLIICLSGPVSEKAFEHAMARTLETGLGILVYTLVSALLWPQTSSGNLNNVSQKLLGTQKRLYQIYRERLLGRDNREGYESLRMQEIQLLDQLEQVLEAAGSESYEVREVRHLWDRLHRESTTVMEILEQWRDGFAQIQQLDMKRVLPDLDAFFSELDRRFQGLERMMDGHAPGDAPRAVPLTLDPSELASLGHFEQAAVTVTRSQLGRLAALIDSLFDCVSDLKEFRPPTRHPEPQTERAAASVFDLDRFQGVVMIIATLWIAFLVWVYVDPPGHSALVQFAPTVAFALARSPQMRGAALLLPFAMGCLLAGVVYVLIMPHLSGYAELGMLIFVAFFLINYLFWQARQGLARLASGVSFISLVTITNQQSYSFADFANQAVFVMMGIALVVATSYIPVSPRPEKALLRLLARFFRSSEFLMSRMAYGADGKRGQSGGWRTAYHRHELATLPQKLWAWTRVIDYRVLPDATPDQLRRLVTSAHAMAFRLKELLEAWESPQSEFLVRELLEDVRAWRLAIQAVLHSLADSMGAGRVSDLQERLEARLAKLEARGNETFDRAEAGELSEADRENFYRLLGSYRGLSEAGIGYAGLAKEVNWARWQEARF